MSNVSSFNQAYNDLTLSWGFPGISRTPFCCCLVYMLLGSSGTKFQI